MSSELQIIPAALPAAVSASQDPDAEFIRLWLGTKVSAHTKRAYQAEAARFQAAVNRPLNLVTLADLQAYAEGLGALKAATQNRALTALKSLLTFGHETGYLPFNVGVAVKCRPNRDRLAERILEESQVAKLIEAAPAGRDRMILKLLYVSGVRVNELCGLTWADAQDRTEGGQITVFGKGGKTRAILLQPKVYAQLLALKGERGASDAIFSSRQGGGALDASQVRRIVYRATAAAGIDLKVSPHWMRHAHASHALDRKAPIHLVQATLGHASVSTTGRYLHARPTDSSSFYLPS